MDQRLSRSVDVRRRGWLVQLKQPEVAPGRRGADLADTGAPRSGLASVAAFLAALVGVPNGTPMPSWPWSAIRGSTDCNRCQCTSDTGAQSSSAPYRAKRLRAFGGRTTASRRIQQRGSVARLRSSHRSVASKAEAVGARGRRADFVRQGRVEPQALWRQPPRHFTPRALAASTSLATAIA